MTIYEKLVIITKKTALEELVERFNTRDQARFYIEHMGIAFDSYQLAHDRYQLALSQLKQVIPTRLRTQLIERSFLPNFMFGEHDLVLVLGPDGLVVNTAKYLTSQALLAINPDPQHIDGVLLPFVIDQAGSALQKTLEGQLRVKQITMAQATLNDGQVLYAVNDLFVGPQSHSSARYALNYQGRVELQSSSGIIISTGAGSTGWFRSLLAGAAGIAESFAQVEAPALRENYRFDWESRELAFVVREPFISKTSGASIVMGRIAEGAVLEVTSAMPQHGVIFSDGVEADYLAFNTGTIAKIGLAEKRLHLVVG